jgi:hypothetical protein
MKPKQMFFEATDEEEVPVEKIAVLFVGSRAAECIQKLADVDNRSAPEFKTGVGKAAMEEVDYILRDGTTLLSDKSHSSFFNHSIHKYQAILFCPTDPQDLDRYMHLVHSNPDKLIRVMTANTETKFNLNRDLVFVEPTSEIERHKILSNLHRDIQHLAETKSSRDDLEEIPKRFGLK